MLRWRPWLVALGTIVACDAPESVPLASAGVAEAVADRIPKEPPGAPMWERLAKSWLYPNPIPNFELTNQDGRNFRLGELRGGHVLVGLIFTHCSIPSACPLTTQKMYEVGKLWRTKKAAGETADQELHLLTLTFDPEADTPEVLANYSEVMRQELPDWRFATGPEPLMETHLPRMFGVIAKKGADGNIAHDVKVVLLGPGLRPELTFINNAFEPEEVVARVLE